MRSNRLFAGIAVFVLMFALLSCSLLYQIKAADQMVGRSIDDQSKVDKVLKKADSFVSEISSLEPTESSASTIISKAAALKENVKDANDDLSNAERSLRDAKALRLPDWYKSKYIAKLEDAAKERKDSLEQMEKMLSKTEQYGKSIQAWYDGNSNIQEAALNLSDFADAIGSNDYVSATDNAEKARTSIKNAQTEFNNAASFVNIKIYSDARDAAGIYAQVIDPLQQIVSLTDEMANTPTENITVEMLSNYLTQIQALTDQVTQILAKGDAVVPADVPDNGAIPQSGKDQLSEWRKENIEPFVSKIDDSLEKAEDLENDARTIKAREG